MEKNIVKLPEYVADGVDGAKVITLIDGSKVTMREPIVSDMLISEDVSTAKSEVALISNLCMKAPSEINAMRVKDYSRLQAVLGYFLYSDEEIVSA